MNEVKRLAKDSLDLDVVEVIREVEITNIRRFWVLLVYSYYSLCYKFSWKKLGRLIFHFLGRFLKLGLP